MSASRRTKWVVVTVLLGALGAGLAAWRLWPQHEVPTDNASDVVGQAHRPETDEPDFDGGAPEPQAFDLVVTFTDGGPAPNVDVVLTKAADESGDLPLCDECQLGIGDACPDPFSGRRYLTTHAQPEVVAHALTNAEGVANFPVMPLMEVRATARVDGLFATALLNTGDGAQLYLEPPHLVGAYAADEAGQPISGATVTFFDFAAGTISTHKTDSAGLASASVPSHRVLIVIEASGYLPQSSTNIEEDSDIDGITWTRHFTLERPHAVIIRTTVAGQPVEADVMMAAVYFGPESNDPLHAPHLKRVRTQQGVVRFEQLPGRTLRVDARAGELVGRIPDLVLTKPETTVDLELRARASLSVIIVDEQGDATTDEVSLNLSDTAESINRFGPMQQRFEFNDVPEGDYRLSVDSEFFRPANQRVALHAGQQSVEITLRRQLTLEGVVVDASDAPLPEVDVHVEGDLGSDTPSTMTDELGHFRMQFQEPGEYRVVALEAAHGRAEATTQVPGSPLRLKLTSRATLEVNVVDDHGAAVPDVQVNVSAPLVGLYQRATSSTDGSARFASVAGVRASLSCWGEGFMPENATVNVATEGVTRATCTLKKKSSVEGDVVDASGHPAAEGSWFVWCDDNVCATSNGAKAAAHFEAEEVVAGQKVSMSVQSATTGERGPPVVVTPPAKGVVLTLPKALHVHGRVVDGIGQPLADVNVNGVVVTSADGRFEVDTAVERGLSLFSEGFRSKAIEVTAQSKDVGTIVLERMTRIIGVVLDAAGKPVGAATVEGSCLATVQTRGDGRFEGPCDSTDPVVVNASRGTSFGSATATVGQEVTIRLASGTRVIGLVLDREGKPRPGIVSYSSADRYDPGEALEAGTDGHFTATMAPGLYAFWARGSPQVFINVSGPEVHVELRTQTTACTLSVVGPDLQYATFFTQGQFSAGADEARAIEAGLAFRLPMQAEGTTDPMAVACGPGVIVAQFATGAVRVPIDVTATMVVPVAAPPPPVDTPDASTPAP